MLLFVLFSEDTKQALKEYAETQPLIFVEYFISDKKKSGGSYVTVTGNFRRIDEYAGNLILTSGEEIHLRDIYSIEGDVFDIIERS